jgi:hypothetical protein
MEKFEELEAKRIRIVDEDGTVRMVLTSPPFPGALFRGKPINGDQNRQEAGLIFYNDEGTECGALSFHGRTGPDGIDAEMMLTFDAYEQDQALTLSFVQRGSERGYGLSMVDRPLTPFTDTLEKQRRIESMPERPEKQQEIRNLSEAHSQRLFLGRLESGEVGLYLMDSKGRPRIRIGVSADDVPRLDFLSETGEVTDSFPPAG